MRTPLGHFSHRADDSPPWGAESWKEGAPEPPGQPSRAFAIVFLASALLWALIILGIRALTAAL